MDEGKNTTTTMTLRRNYFHGRTLPLVAVAISMVGALFAAGATLSLLNVERPASATLAVLGDGVDEFALRSAQISDFVPWLRLHTRELTMLAVVATAISLLAIILHLVRSLRSAGDARGFFSYLMDRIRLSSLESNRWGTIRDRCAGHRVPLARLTLVAGDGTVVATTVADMDGRYGFRLPLDSSADASLTLQVKKGGYHDAYQSGSAFPFDVHLDAVGPDVTQHAGPARFTAALASMSFWVSVATVPLAASVVPNPLSFLLIAGLIATTIGRLCGLAIHHQ